MDSNLGPLQQVLLELALGLARYVATQAEINEEEYPAFEEELVPDYLGALDFIAACEEGTGSAGVYDQEAEVLTLGGVEYNRAITTVQRSFWGTRSRQGCSSLQVSMILVKINGLYP